MGSLLSQRHPHRLRGRGMKAKSSLHPPFGGGTRKSSRKKISLYHTCRQKFVLPFGTQGLYNTLYYTTTVSLYLACEVGDGKNGLLSRWTVQFWYNIMLAICSPNFIQVGKGRDWKMVFCRVRDIKNVEPKARLFFMSNPVKNCFLIESFRYENKILRTHNLLHFFVSNRTEKFPIHSSRPVMF